MLIVKRSNRCAFPPTGSPTSPPGTSLEFNDIKIKKPVPRRLLPEGSRQSGAEARILYNIIAIEQNRAPLTTDIIGR